MIPPEAAQTAPATLTLERIIQAKPAQVFEAWTKPEQLVKWFGPQGFSVANAQIELQNGGKYQISLLSPDGDHIHHFGEYVDIVPDRRLVFTWVLSDQDCQGSRDLQAETLVTVELTPVEQTTKLVLTHEKLPTQAAIEGHKFGWQSSLDGLQACLEGVVDT